MVLRFQIKEEQDPAEQDRNNPLISPFFHWQHSLRPQYHFHEGHIPQQVPVKFCRFFCQNRRESVFLSYYRMNIIS